MKKIILLFAILVSINYNLNAQIAITGNITTAGVAVYPTHIDSLGKGGLMTLPDLTTRNALPVKRRKQGMLVFVQANDSLYKLATADLSNNGWVAMGLLTQQKLSDSLNSRLKGADTLSLSNRINLKANVDNITDMNNALTLKLNIIDTTDLFQKRDTSFLLQKKDTSSLSNRIDLKASITALNNLNTTINNKLAIDTSYLLQKKDTSYLLQKADTASLSNRINLKTNTDDFNTLTTTVGTKFKTTDTSYLLQKVDTASLSNRIDLKNNTVDFNTLTTTVGTKLNTTDTSYLLQKADTASLSNRIDLKTNTVDFITLTTTVGTKFKITDTSYLLQKTDTASLSNRINLKANTTELNTLTTTVGTKFKTTDTSYLLQKADTASLSNRINKKFNTTDTSFLLKKTDTSFLLKKTDTSFLLKKSDTTYLLQKVDTTAILAMYAKKFTKDVVLNGVSSFGKYTNGQTIPAKGKTLDEFLYDVVTKVVLPTYTAPSVSISASPAFGAYEIGYDPGQVTLSNTYTKNDAGNVTLTTYNKGGTSLGAGVNINSPGPITSSVSYNVTVNYGAGTTVKIDNLGNPYPTGQITAGSTSSGSGSYSTYSKRFWGGTSVAFTASNTYNYASLSQALGSDNSGSSNSITVSLTPTGTQNVFFAYLASSPDLSSILYNGLENIDAFTKTLITITNAQGHTQSYKVYTSKEVYSSMLKDIIFK